VTVNLIEIRLPKTFSALYLQRGLGWRYRSDNFFGSLEIQSRKCLQKSNLNEITVGGSGSDSLEAQTVSLALLMPSTALGQ
jgi:hypothetical protein